MTRYMRWLEAERGLELAATTRRSGAGRSTSSRTSGPRSGSTSRSAPTAPVRAVLADREMPGREWFAGARSTTPSTSSAAGDADDGRGPARLRAARARRAHLGRAARRRSRAFAAGLRALGVERGDRVVAYLPNSPETLIAFLATASIGAIWSSLLARLRRLDASSTASPRSSRRCCSRSTATATTAATSTACDVVAELERAMPTLEHTVVLPYLDPDADLAARAAAIALGRASRRPATGAELAFEQVPFDHPLWVLYSSGTTGPAEGDRPGPRRDPARAAEEAQPPPRRAAGRPRLLVHDDRLDDVELPRRRAAHRRLDRALRRQPRPPRHGRALGPRRGGRRHLLRHLRQLHRRLHEGRGRAGLRPRPLARCARSARPARRSRPRASSGSTTTSAPTPGCSRPRAAPTSAPRSSAACPILPVYRGELQARSLGCAVEAWDEDGKAVIDEVGELVITEPMPSMPVFFWGDEDGSRYRECYFEMFPGRLAPRRLDRDHLARHGDHLRALGLDDQPLRDPHGHERDLPRGRLGRRGHRRARRRHPAARDRGLDAAVRRPARGRRARRRADRARSRSGSASTARRATCPTGSTRSPRCRGRCPARCSRCR